MGLHGRNLLKGIDLTARGREVPVNVNANGLPQAFAQAVIDVDSF